VALGLVGSHTLASSSEAEGTMASLVAMLLEEHRFWIGGRLGSRTMPPGSTGAASMTPDTVGSNEPGKRSYTRASLRQWHKGGIA